ncbi:MAG: hypothetical protein WDZ70_00310 [Candidatus Paceibacterota bacterium]
MPKVYIQLTIAALIFATTAVFTQAQTALPSITANPALPGAYESVTLRLTPENVLQGTRITWSSGNTVLREGVGVTSISVNAGALGTKKQITARFTDTTGDQAVVREANITLTPADVDLIWEAESYVPPFYNGKALVPQEGAVKVVAIPHVAGESSDNLIYNWSYNGRNYADRSGRGVTTFRLPTLPRRATVEVEVSRANGTVIAQEVTQIQPQDSLVRVYRDHPLLGVVESFALDSNVSFRSQEETFVAYPFYFSALSPQEEALEYMWQVNGRAITGEDNVLTVRRERERVRATFSLSLSHRFSTFQRALADFVVTLREDE